MTEQAQQKPLTEGQRAMAAGRMPGNGAEAGRIWQVNRLLVSNARAVLKYGTPAEIASVDNGSVKVSTMANYVRARQVAQRPPPVSRPERLQPEPSSVPPAAVAIPSSVADNPATVSAVVTMPTAEIIPLRPRKARRDIGPKLPPGTSIDLLARKAIAMRNSGNYPSVDLVAKALGIHNAACRQMMDITMIADREDLPEHEATIAADAMRRMMNGLHRLPDVHAMIEPIAKRLWGDMRTSKTRAATEASRLDRFDRGYGILITACTNAAKIEIPHLSEDRVREILAEVSEAIRDVKAFASKIGDIHR